MASADYGMGYTGAIVSQAVSCHLPFIILSDMKKLHYFFHVHCNIWLDDMTRIAGRAIYPENIGGQAWFGKITDTLG